MEKTDGAIRHQLTYRENGKNIKWDCVINLRNLGSNAVLTAGASTPFDVISWDQESIYLIQVVKIETVDHIDQAVDQARQAWRAHWEPFLEGVHREVWLRCNDAWHIRDLDASQ